MSRQDRFSWFASKDSKASKQHRQRRPKPSSARAMGLARSLHVEALEDRCMLAVITVTSLADNTFPGGGVTLREAIQAANTDTSVDGSVAGNGANTINFAAALSGQTIDLGGELEITEALTIDATSLASDMTIDANNASRIFNITAPTGDFTLAGLTLTGGRTTGESSGGAIHSLTTGNLTIDQSTVSESSTTGDYAYGGGIFSRGGVTLTSSTVSGNSTTGSSAYGGGIRSSADVTLTSSTVTDNRANDSNATGGGIWNKSGTITLANSIVAGNTAGSGNPDIDPGTGTFTANFSLLGTTVTPDAGGSGNLFDDIPLLAPLADNGGPTETHALLVGSPAIDAGDPGFSSPPDFDQRGAPFARVVGGRIDIGALEDQPIPDSADFDTDGDIDGADFLAWQRGFGTPSANKPDGDADNDDDVDLGIWEAQFGGPALLAAASTASVSASTSVEEPSPIESVATLATLFVEPVTPANLPANLIDAALATEWLGIVPEGKEETSASPRREVTLEAVFAASVASDRFAPAGKSLAKFGTSNANSEEVKVEEVDSDLPWLSGELLERVFG